MNPSRRRRNASSRTTLRALLVLTVLGIALLVPAAALADEPASITVTAPTGASTQAQGTSLPVTWTTNAPVSGGEFSLWLVSPANGWYGGKLVAADGSASYASSLALDVPVAAGYRVFVYHRASAADPWGVYGFASGTVDVTAGALSAISVTAPVGALSHAQGDLLSVNWTPDQAVSSGEFSLWLVSPENGWYVGEIVAADGSASYADSVALSVPVGAGYRVFVYYRATPADPWGVYGFASASVTVTAPAFSAITVTAPTGASTQAQGTSLPVTWTTNAPVSGGEFSLWLVSPANGWYGGKLVAADGSASYASSLALDVPVAAGYRVFVYHRASAADPWGVYGFASGTVDVTAGALSAISVTAPVGALSHAQGDLLSVNWTPDQAVSSGEFSLWLVSPENGWYVGEIVAADGSASYADSVALSVPVGAGYRVFVYYRATPADPWGVYGFASASVTVTAPAFSAITVTAPTGASTQAQGTSLPVTWTTNAPVSGGEFSLWLVSPANGWYGGKLVAADGSASYASSLALDVPVAAGYRVFVYHRASAADPWGVYGLASGTVDVSAAGGPTYVSGTISSDTTWSAGESPFIVDGSVAVSIGATLTVQPGVEVRFQSGASLDVQGHIVAIGSSSKPILLTSAQAAPVPGDWHGITSAPSSAEAHVTFDHVTVQYAEIGVDASGPISLTSCVIADSLGSAVRLTNVGSSTAVINNEFRDSGGYGLEASALAQGADLSFVDLGANTFTRNNGGDAGRNVSLTGTVAHDWVTPGALAYRCDLDVAAGAHLTMQASDTAYLCDDLDVAAGATLTIAPETNLDFNEGGVVMVAGNLEARGLMAAPISMFCSARGTSSTPWVGIEVGPTGSATLDWVEVYRATMGVAAESGARLTVAHSTIAECGWGCLVVGISAPVVVRGNTFRDNQYWGIEASTYSSGDDLSYLEVTSNTFSGNGSASGSVSKDVHLYGSVRRDWSLVPETHYVCSLNVASGAALTLWPGSGQYDGHGGIAFYVQGGATMAVMPGAVLAGCDIEVSGALSALGTSTAPIQFTTRDPSPAAGQWNGIAVDGTAQLEYCVITYARTAISNGPHGQTHISNSRILDCSFGISNQPDSPLVHAENNFWGSEQGPAPYGSGPGISWHTEYDSWNRPYAVFDVDADPWTGHAADFGTLGWGGYAADPVNVTTGNFISSNADLSIDTRGLPLEVVRSYNSASGVDSPFGYGWAFTFGLTLRVDVINNSVLLTREDGRVVSFKRQSDGSYVPSAGEFDVLQRSPATRLYTLTTKDGTSFSFDMSGRLTEAVDRNGNATSLQYNAEGNLTAVSAPDGRSLRFASDPNGHITAVVDPADRRWTYAYNSAGDLISVTDPLQGITTYDYDRAHRMTKQTDANGNVVVENEYDESGRCIRQVDGRGEWTLYGYDIPNRRTTVFLHSVLHQTGYLYDSDHRITATVTPGGAQTSNTYDEQNNKTSVTDPLGRITSYTYDDRGNVLATTNALGRTATTTYDTHNNPLSSTDFAGYVRDFEYDARGNLTREVDPVGHAVTHTYDSLGRLTSTTDQLGEMTSHTYGAYDYPETTTLANGATTTITSDILGNVQSSTSPLGTTTTYMHDTLGRLTWVRDPAGHATMTTYDAVGNKLTVIDAKGNTTRYTYDERNDLVSVTDALGHVTVYAYDAFRNRTEVTDANGHATRYTYDALQHLTSVTDALGKASFMSYDVAGNKIASTDAKGQATIYAYDGLNRLTNVTKADGATVSYAYDANGNKTSMTDSLGTTTYSYDDRGLLTGCATPDGETVSYQYDAAGRRTQVRYPDGKQVSYQFDAVGQLAGVTDYASHETRYAYRSDGSLETVDLPNGVTGARTYDDAGELTSIVYTRGGDLLLSLDYAKDANGNRTVLTDSLLGTTSYEYDALDRLTRERVPWGDNITYTYDPVGNRMSWSGMAYSYNAANQMLGSPGGATYTYDANGSRTQRDMGDITSYAYNADNLLASVTDRTGTTSYAYNGDGQRMAVTSGGKTTSFVLDQTLADEAVLQESTEGSVTTYTYGFGLISRESPSGIVYYLTDALGSTRLLTDGSGSVVAGCSYYAFGGQAHVTNAVGNKFAFTGQWADVDGLTFLRARFYDTLTGRFLSVDPVPGSAAEPQSLNPYVYCENNPVMSIDPSGEFSLGQAWKKVTRSRVVSTLYRYTRIGSVTQLGYQLGTGDFRGALVTAASMIPGPIGTIVTTTQVYYEIGRAADSYFGCENKPGGCRNPTMFGGNSNPANAPQVLRDARGNLDSILPSQLILPAGMQPIYRTSLGHYAQLATIGGSATYQYVEPPTFKPYTYGRPYMPMFTK